MDPNQFFQPSSYPGPLEPADKDSTPTENKPAAVVVAPQFSVLPPAQSAPAPQSNIDAAIAAERLRVYSFHHRGGSLSAEHSSRKKALVIVAGLVLFAGLVLPVVGMVSKYASSPSTETNGSGTAGASSTDFGDSGDNSSPLAVISGMLGGSDESETANDTTDSENTDMSSDGTGSEADSGADSGSNMETDSEPYFEGDTGADTGATNEGDVSTVITQPTTPTPPIQTPIVTTPTPTPTPPPTVNIATYNILGTNVRSWDSTRANAILNYIKTTDITAVQEGRSDSIAWLTTRLGSAGYKRTSNEWARNIFWKTSMFTYVKQGEKQLNTGKDLVWVKLRHTATGKYFYVATLHLNISGSTDRIAELKIALPYMAANMKDAPIIFLGDMNSERGSTEDKQIKAAGFQDSYDIAASKIHLTYRTTVSGFKGGLTGTIDTTSTHQIDHIYVKGNLGVSRVEIVAQKGSDHLPVEADIQLK